ncbi:MAG: helix-turn-helix domain-containing protein [Pseudomonadota bacterium]
MDSIAHLEDLSPDILILRRRVNAPTEQVKRTRPFVYGQAAECCFEAIRTSALTHFQISQEDFNSRRHTQRVMRQRQASVFLLRLIPISFPVIGELISRDYTTALGSYQRAEGLFRCDQEWRVATAAMFKSLTNAGVAFSEEAHSRFADNAGSRGP